MAPDKSERYASAAELRDALREWQQHQSSVVLTDRAEQALRTLDAASSYADYLRVTQDFAAALDDWPDNARARSGLLGARAAHARAAICRGDLELASDLVTDDPSHAEVRSELELARSRLASTRRRASHTRLAFVLAALAGLFSAAWLVWDWQRSFGRWHVAYELSVDEAAVADLIAAHPSPGKTPRIQDGGVRLPRAEIFFLPAFAATDNVRIEVDMQWDGPVDGFELMLRSLNDPPFPWVVPAGYSCQFGGYTGLVSFIAQNRAAGPTSTADGLYIPFESGKRYQVAFSLQADQAVIEVDGVERFRVGSLLPLGDGRFGHAGLRSWGDVTVYGIVLKRQALPAKPTPLLAGDSLVAAGHYIDAARTYEQIATDFDGQDLAADALARAYLAALLEPSLKDKRVQLLDRLLTKYPNTPHRQRCEEGAAYDAWLNGHYDDALGRAEQVLRRFPTSRIATKLAEAKSVRVARPRARRLLALLARSKDVRRVRLAHFDIGDLSPLRGMPLIDLDVSATHVSDLSPLQGMPLERLIVRLNGGIKDLTPLRGMPLKELDVSSTGVSSLEVLRGMPLVRLHAGETPVTDLTPLAGLKLRQLLISGTGVRDISALAGMPLERLDMNWLGIGDLSVLRAAPLFHLNASGNRISDLRPFASRSFDELHLEDNLVEDISPLATTKGRILGLEHNRIRDLTPLKDARWGTVSLGSNPISDVSPLKECGASKVSLQDLSALRIGPLAGASIKELDLSGTTLLDPEALARFPNLTRLYGGHYPADAAAARRLQGELEAAGKADIAASLRTLTLALRGDTAALRESAVKVGAHRILQLRASFTREQALQLAERFGSRLPILSDRALWDHVAAQTPEWSNVWLDLGVQGSRLVWGDGGEAPLARVSPGNPMDPMPADGWVGFRIESELWLVRHEPGGASWFRAMLYLTWTDP